MCVLQVQMAQPAKNPPAGAGDVRDSGFDPWVGKIPGEGNGGLLQCSCLGNPMDRGAWRAAVHEVAERQTELSRNTSGALSREGPAFLPPPRLPWKNSDYLPDGRLPAPPHWLP